MNHEPIPGLAVNTRVVRVRDTGSEAGIVRWIGLLPGADQINEEYFVGVEFDNPVGSGTGEYNDQRIFSAKQGHASLVPIVCLIKETDYLGQETKQDCRSTSPRKVEWAEGENMNHEPIPGLAVNTRVVRVRDTGSEAGIVRWIGLLPGADQRNEEYFVGVEFDNPVGSGTGEYNDQRIFSAKQGHASLVPIVCLIKETDYLGQETKQGCRSTSPKNVEWAEGENMNHEPITGLAVNTRVVRVRDTGAEAGIVKWIGLLPGADQRYEEYFVGVEFDNPVNSRTGKYNNQRIFSAKHGHASLVPILGLIKEADFLGQDTKQDCRSTSPRKVEWAEGENMNHEPIPGLAVNTRVVRVKYTGSEAGIVRWIGLLPGADQRNEKYTVGVEFDNPVVSRTGKYNDQRIFLAKEGHASLVPILGLIKEADFLGQDTKQDMSMALTLESSKKTLTDLPKKGKELLEHIKEITPEDLELHMQPDSLACSRANPVVLQNKKISSSVSGGSMNGEDWKYQISFDPEADKSKSKDDIHSITDQELMTTFATLVGEDEDIIEIASYKCRLFKWLPSMGLLYHMFIVFKTKSWWWSIEKNTKDITVQRSKNMSAVKDKYSQVNRLCKRNVELVQSYAGRTSVFKLVRWLYKESFLIFLGEIAKTSEMLYIITLPHTQIQNRLGSTLFILTPKLTIIAIVGITCISPMTSL